MVIKFTLLPDSILPRMVSDERLQAAAYFKAFDNLFTNVLSLLEAIPLFLAILCTEVGRRFAVKAFGFPASSPSNLCIFPPKKLKPLIVGGSLEGFFRLSDV